MMSTQKILTVLISAVLISGCGYTMRACVRSDIKTISIETFENKTFEHEVETALSEILLKEFILDGTLSIVNASDADVQLSGEIVKYVLEPYTYGTDESDVEQYRIYVHANVSFRKTGEEEAIWKELIEGDATYYLSGALAKTEEEASELALSELAKKIVSRVVRAW